MAWEARSARRQTLPADWSSRRTRILRRDRRQCQIRGPRCIGTATEVDHVGAADDHRDEVLRSACTPCHGLRSATQGGVASGSARRSRATSRTRPPEPHPSERTAQ